MAAHWVPAFAGMTVGAVARWGQSGTTRVEASASPARFVL